eukprot:2311467-Pleurochrysis_carterae.AAC.1
MKTFILFHEETTELTTLMDCGITQFSLSKLLSWGSRLLRFECCSTRRSFSSADAFALAVAGRASSFWGLVGGLRAPLLPRLRALSWKTSGASD